MEKIYIYKCGFGEKDVAGVDFFGKKEYNEKEKISGGRRFGKRRGFKLFRRKEAAS